MVDMFNGYEPTIYWHGPWTYSTSNSLWNGDFTWQEQVRV